MIIQTADTRPGRSGNASQAQRGPIDTPGNLLWFSITEPTRIADHLMFGLRSSCERAEFMLALVMTLTAAPSLRPFAAEKRCVLMLNS